MGFTETWPPGTPPPGTVLAGKYTVERVLGVGGMGIVVAARHVHLEQRVAVKLLLPEAASNPEAVTRFLREGRAATQIKSEHVVRVHDVDILDPWGPALVLELLDGQDLGDVLAAGVLPIPVAVDYVLQACEAIAEAHALGIVHRDLKPENLFLTQRADGTACVKVLDFGISKVAAPAGDQRLTTTGAVFGTPTYMAPEQLRESRDTDARTDIWALGGILFELCSGRLAFPAGTLTELTAKVLMDPAPRLRELRGDAPKGFEAAIMRCLEKKPEQRFQNLAELARAIQGFGTPLARASTERIVRVLEPEGRVSLVMPTPGDAHKLGPAATATLSPSSSAAGASRARGKPWWTLAGLVLGLATTAVVGALVLRGRGAHVEAHPSSASATASAPAPPAATVAPTASAAPAVTEEPARTGLPDDAGAPSHAASSAAASSAHTRPKTPPGTSHVPAIATDRNN